MIKEKAKITSKGQVTIPKSIRERFGLDPGTQVIFKEDMGQIKVEPVIEKPLKELRELREDLDPLTREEIKEMMEETRKSWDRFG